MKEDFYAICTNYFIGIKWLMQILPAIIISWIWWFANYLYKVSKWEQFKFIKLIINISLAAWLWYVVQWWIESSSKLYWPTLSITWFCAYPILQWLEKQWDDLIVKLFKK